MAEPLVSAAPLVSTQEIQRLEARLRDGWPALETAEDDGWILGASGRDSRRANSVAPVGDGAGRLDDRIDRAERFHRAHGLRPVFKMTAAARPEALDAHLAARGYVARSETLVMTRPISSDEASAPTRPWDSKVRLVEGRVETAWLSRSIQASGLEADLRADYRAILERAIETTRTFFVSVEGEEGVRSLAFGALARGTVSLARIATMPAWRGRRLAELAIRRLLEAASERGATEALLPVEAENVAALRLYGRLGFVERYRYWYREAPTGP